MTFLLDLHHIGQQQTGNETFARNTARELVALSSPGDLTFAASSGGLADVQALTGTRPYVVSPSPYRRVGFDLPRLAKRVDASALLVHYTKPLTRRPCAVVIHDLSPFDPQSRAWLDWTFRRRVQASISLSARHASALIAPSEFTRQGLISRFSLDPSRVVVAPNAVDPDLAELIDGATSRRRPIGRPRVVTVGNVLPRKNLATVGAAIRDLRGGGLDVELRVVGSVPAAGRQVADALQRLLPDAVSFTGYVSNEELALEYIDADVLAFPSLFEGFGIPAIEAMRAGLPVIVSDAGSLPEVVGDAGLVVPANDRAGWAQQLAGVLSDVQLRASLIGRGRAQAARTNWQDSARTVLRTLNTIVRGND